MPGRRTREPVGSWEVLGAVGVVVCALALWRGWPPVVWWIGSAALTACLAGLAWIRGGRRAIWFAGAVVIGLAVAAVPVVEPAVRSHAPVAWSVEGTEQPVAATDSLILTVDADRRLRARQADDGAVKWERDVPAWPEWDDPPVVLADDVVLVGARHLAERGDRMHALDAATGEVLWSGDARVTPMVRHDGTLAVFARDDQRGDVHRGVDLATGEVQWTRPGTVDARTTTIPARTPGSGILESRWLVATRTSDSAAGFAVVEVATGEVAFEIDTDGAAVAGALENTLVVQEVRMNDDELRTVREGAVIPSRVSAYDVGTGDVSWRTRLDLGFDDWYVQFQSINALNTVDGRRLMTSPDGAALQVLDLSDGAQREIDAPPGTHFTMARPGLLSGTRARWVGKDTALAPLDGPDDALVDLTGATAPVVTPAAGRGIEATITLDDAPAPVWREERSGLFGREYDELVAIEDADGTSAEPADLGVLPDAAIAGMFADRVVLVASEADPDATDEEPPSATAMHVLAPYD